MTDKTTCPHIEGSIQEHTRKEHTITETTKSSSTTDLSIKSVSVAIGVILTIGGAFWAMDTHYAKAEDVVKLQVKTAADVEKLQINVEVQFAQARVDRLEDELFKLDAKKQAQEGRLDPIDTAMYERYVRRLQQVQQQSRSVIARATQ